MLRCTLVLVSFCLFSCSDSGRPTLDSGTRPVDSGGGGRDSATAGDSATGGGAGIGEACAVDSDCTNPPDARCFTEVTNPLTGETLASYPNGFCSKGCETTADCGTGDDVTCVTQSSSGGGGGSSSMLCTTSCTSDAECRQAEGYRCQMLLGFGFCTP
ncbi:MAG: hypothetical protein AAGE52_16485 [Myxococcota bacterium]